MILNDLMLINKDKVYICMLYYSYIFYYDEQSIFEILWDSEMHAWNST